MTTSHEHATELLARAAFVLGRVDGLFSRAQANRSRQQFVRQIRGWLLGSCTAPGRWATVREIEEETRIAHRRLNRARALVAVARRQLSDSPCRGYPPHLQQVIALEVIALEGDLADVSLEVAA